jgi:HPt (histidine-containing phosphotransfer) domain-containing protein
MTATRPTAAAPLVQYSRLADDADLAELIELFVGELPDRLACMTAAAESADWKLLGNLAHQLKGAGGSHGFDSLTPLAYQLERAARTGQSAADIHAALNALKAGCSLLRAGSGSR